MNPMVDLIISILELYTSYPQVEEENNIPRRIIAHLDIDCFQCQIYQLDQPLTKGKPCVAANSQGRIVSVSYEAKKKNISRSIQIPEAKKRCPDLVVFEIPEKYGKPHSSKLRHASEEVLDTIRNYCNENAPEAVLEFHPHDKFYLDLTKVIFNKSNIFVRTFHFVKDSWKFLAQLLFGFALFAYLISKLDALSTKNKIPGVFVAFFIICFVITCKFKKFTVKYDLLAGKQFMKKLCNEVKEKTRLTASAGVSTNKIRAKLVSSENKPNGVFALFPDDFETTIGRKQLHEVPGLKSGLEQKIMEIFGIEIQTIKELKEISRLDLLLALAPGEYPKILQILEGNDDEEPVVDRAFSRTIHCRKTFPVQCKTQSVVLMEIKKGYLVNAFCILVWKIFKWFEIEKIFWRGSAAVNCINESRIKSTLKDLIKELVERLREEKIRNSIETKSLRVDISYVTDSQDPSSERTEMRTFRFEASRGLIGIFNKAWNKIRTTEGLNDDGRQVTKIGMTAKNWIEF